MWDYLRQQTAREVKAMKEDEAKAAQKAARNGKAYIKILPRWDF